MPVLYKTKNIDICNKMEQIIELPDKIWMGATLLNKTELSPYGEYTVPMELRPSNITENLWVRTNLGESYNGLLSLSYYVGFIKNYFYYDQLTDSYPKGYTVDMYNSSIGYIVLNDTLFVYDLIKHIVINSIIISEQPMRYFYSNDIFSYFYREHANTFTLYNRVTNTWTHINITNNTTMTTLQARLFTEFLYHDVENEKFYFIYSTFFTQSAATFTTYAHCYIVCFDALTNTATIENINQYTPTVGLTKRNLAIFSDRPAYGYSSINSNMTKAKSLLKDTYFIATDYSSGDYNVKIKYRKAIPNEEGYLKLKNTSTDFILSIVSPTGLLNEDYPDKQYSIQEIKMNDIDYLFVFQNSFTNFNTDINRATHYFLKLDKVNRTIEVIETFNELNQYVLYSKDHTLYFCTQNQVNIYYIDFVNEKINYIKTIYAPYKFLSMDSFGNIWYKIEQNIIDPVLNKTYITGILDKDTVDTLSIKSEQLTYHYENQVINTYIDIEAFSDTGTRISADTTLRITGPAVFMNDTKQQTVTTNNNGTIRVYIKIINIGDIYISGHAIKNS